MPYVLGNYIAPALIKKGVVAVTVLAGTYAAIKVLPYCTPIRTKMQRAFEAGEICSTKKNKNTTVKKYPKIESIKSSKHCLTIRYKLPLGVSPEDVLRKDWLFAQAFDRPVIQYQDKRSIVLEVFSRDLPDFYEYRYEEIAPLLDGLHVPIYAGVGLRGPIVYDMALAPNLIIAGETGAGKSTQLRSILTTLLLSRTPEQLELYLADLKMTEFNLFANCKHVQAVAYAPDQVLQVTKYLLQEVAARQELLFSRGVQSIYELPVEERPPTMIFAIDEVIELKGYKNIVDDLISLTSRGRALGLFFIFSMQRPDADVLDGKIKNNLTVRMAFRHPDQINFRITLGEEAPEVIAQSARGRMWLRLDTLQLLQAPYLSTEYAREILAPIFVDEENP